MLVVSIVLIGTVGAESANSIQDELTSQLSYPEYGSNAFDSLKDDSDLITIKGTVPGLTENKEKLEWLNLIDECLTSSDDELNSYIKESDGTLVAFGTDYGGYLFVVFDKNMKGEIDDSITNKLYDVISTNAEKTGVSDIPVVFMYGGEDIEESRSSYWRPIIGGIKITHPWPTYSTVAFAAEDGNGNEGYVMSGHAALSGGGIGSDISQYFLNAGTITDIGGYYSDSAWVEYSNVNPEIYYDDTNILKDVYAYMDPSLGSSVYQSGARSGLTDGVVTKTYHTQQSSSFGYLYKQFSADYDSESGDSGGPVFTTTTSGKLILYGLHKGRYNGDAAFSPISGIKEDLDIEPLTA